MEKDLSLAGEFTRLHNKYCLNKTERDALEKRMKFGVTDILSRGNLLTNDKGKY
jgi:hypothetical protein